MDVSSTTMTFTHLFIIWTLLGVLLLWILLFAFLALRPDKEKAAEGPTIVFTPQAPVAHTTQVALSSQPHTQVYESVGEAAPIV